jgi:hypothetical protein
MTSCKYELQGKWVVQRQQMITSDESVSTTWNKSQNELQETTMKYLPGVLGRRLPLNEDANSGFVIAQPNICFAALQVPTSGY